MDGTLTEIDQIKPIHQSTKVFCLDRSRLSDLIQMEFNLTHQSFTLTSIKPTSLVGVGYQFTLYLSDNWFNRSVNHHLSFIFIYFLIQSLRSDDDWMTMRKSANLIIFSITDLRAQHIISLVFSVTGSLDELEKQSTNGNEFSLSTALMVLEPLLSLGSRMVRNFKSLKLDFGLMDV